MSDYKIFIKDLTSVTGTALYYPIIARMHKMYKEDFIVSCANAVYKKKFDELDPKGKSMYLATVCKNAASASDVKNSKNKLDIEGF